MKKEGTIIIKGFQNGLEEEAIITKAPVTYHFRNNKHFAHYEERDQEGLLIAKNTLKISSNQVDIIKRGNNNSHMVFHDSNITKTCYYTPYGMLEFQIQTSGINIKETKGLIEVDLKYSLLSDSKIISDNYINIVITSDGTNLRD